MKRLVFILIMFSGLLFPQLDSTVVASIGHYRISTDDLLTSFEFGPAFVKRHKEPLREHLRFMINERLFALEGEENRLDTAAFIRTRVKGLEEDGAVEQLYRQEILSKVLLTDEQIANDTRKAKVTVALRWIFVPTTVEAEQTAAKLKSGTSFDSLYRAQYTADVEPESRSVETTLLKLERDNPGLALKLTEMNNGGISPPVSGKDGYYIFRLDEARQNPITTETDYTELKNQAIEIRTQLIADGRADVYVKQMMKKNEPVIKADGFNILRAYLADKGLSKDTKVQWQIPSTFMTEAGPQPIQNSGRYLQKTLATFGKQSISIREYAEWYDIRQFQFDTHSLEAFNRSVKKTIWKMVQDRLLSKEAYARGLDKLPTVANETMKWDAKLLYLAQRASVIRSLSADEKVLRKYFMANQRQYMDENGTILPFEKVHAVVTRDYTMDMENVAIMNHLEILKNKYPVTVNEELLAALSTQHQSDPRAVDAIIYKPGGTFPRVAFPTIDEVWSEFK